MLAIHERIRRCWGGEIVWDCPLAGYSTLKVGGPADALIQPGSRDELVRLVGRLTEEEVPWRVIGRGSNILVADEGVEGVVIVLGQNFAAIREVAAANGRRVEVEAGCTLARLAHWCWERSLSGLEFAVGIPGTVGGAIMMNAGAWGGEISRVISSVTLVDAAGRLEERQLSPADFCYRGWQRPHGKVVVSGVFALAEDERTAIAERCQRYARQRAAKQPKAVASAGSFFKNPAGEAAGRLIEQAGLKGLRVGDAEVSLVHANFLVNRGGAKAADFRELMKRVQREVRDKFGVELHPEVEFVGRWQETDEKPLGEKTE